MGKTQTETKTFAQFKTSSNRLGEALEIRDVQEAIDYGTRNGMGSFQTYEVTSVILNCKELTGSPENWSGTHYLCVDNLLTAADIAELFEKRIQQRKAAKGSGVDADGTPFNDATWAEIHARKEVYFRNLYKDKPANAGFIRSCDGDGYTELAVDSKAYNKSGQQIWPKPAPPTPSSKPKPRSGGHCHI